MGLTVDDLKPQPIEFEIRGVKLKSKPLRLSHALIFSRVGPILDGSVDATAEQIKKAEQDVDSVIAELIPELDGVELDINTTMDVITNLMDNVQPSDNKELEKKGVSLGDDPKAPTTG